MNFVNQFLIIPMFFILALCQVQAQDFCGAHAPDSAIVRMDQLQPFCDAFSDQWTLQRQQSVDNSVVQIPLKIHIVRESNGTGGLDPNEVDDILDEVNAFYAPGGYVFFLCGDIAFVNNSTYYDFDESEEGGLFALSYVENVINVYFVGNVTMGSNQPFCGYANFPFQNVEEDFVMVANSCGSNTLAHELAHYFGVYHTHGAVNVGCSTDELVNGSNCDAAGDRVCDTPADPGLSSACNTVNNCQYVGAAQDINGQYYNPDVQNLMSYAPQYCRNHFSTGQFARMAYYQQNYRTNLICSTGGGACSGQTTLSDCAGTISDGSGNNNYGDMLSCSWLIQPVNATSITLTFSAFDTENGYDFVTIYDGPNANAPVLGTYNGNMLPPVITANSGQMFITFTSDETINGAGWTASYSCANGGGGGGACNGQTNLSDCTGTISDGSGNNNYGDMLNCSWLIQPANATSITLTFSAFETEYDYDLVVIYDGPNANAPVLGIFSGNTIPPAITANSGQMFITFTSDESIGGAGWTASYSCSGGGGGCSFTPHVTVNSCYLTAPNGSNYQWFKNGDPIPGATGQSYAATANASYRVKMTDPNGCQGESQLVLVFCLTDASEVEAESRLYLAPNPAQDQTVVYWENWPVETPQLEVMAPDGRLIGRWFVEKSEAGQFALPVADWPGGVYIVRLGERTQRLIVQH